MNFEPEIVEKLKRDLLIFAGLVLLMAAFFGLGWLEATRSAAGKLKEATAAAASHGAASKALGAQGNALRAQAQAEEPRLAASLRTLAGTSERTKKALEAVNALHLPDIPQDKDLDIEREAVSALQDENAKLRDALSAAITRGDLYKASSDKFESAWKEEQLHSLALQGQLAAQQADQRRAVLFAKIKGVGAGIALDEAVHLLSHR